MRWSHRIEEGFRDFRFWIFKSKLLEQVFQRKLRENLPKGDVVVWMDCRELYLFGLLEHKYGNSSHYGSLLSFRRPPRDIKALSLSAKF
jgi:hypothetical protein